MKLINELLMFILMISKNKKYNIDESHDISHSMDVLHFANDIYEQQVYLYPPLKDYKNVIQICALLHDMCDKKYMDEKTGSQEIFSYLEPRIESRESDPNPNLVLS